MDGAGAELRRTALRHAAPDQARRPPAVRRRGRGSVRLERGRLRADRERRGDPGVPHRCRRGAGDGLQRPRSGRCPGRGEGELPGLEIGCYRITTAGGPGCGGGGRGVSDASGLAELDGLGSGTYQVPLGSRDGYYRTSHADFVVAAGIAGTTGNPEFGVVRGLSEIEGLVFEDLDADGDKDPGESGVTDIGYMNVCATGPVASGCARCRTRVPTRCPRCSTRSTTSPSPSRTTAIGSRPPRRRVRT